MPAKLAQYMVPATVVLPFIFLATTYAKSLLLHFLLFFGPFLDKYSISDLLKPILITPLMMAMVAGTAPSLRMMPSTAIAVSKLCGYCIPCVIIVDSRATTAFFSRRAFFTSGAISKYLELILPIFTFPSFFYPEGFAILDGVAVVFNAFLDGIGFGVLFFDEFFFTDYFAMFLPIFFLISD